MSLAFGQKLQITEKIFLRSLKQREAHWVFALFLFDDYSMKLGIANGD